MTLLESNETVLLEFLFFSSNVWAELMISEAFSISATEATIDCNNHGNRMKKTKPTPLVSVSWFAQKYAQRRKVLAIAAYSSHTVFISWNKELFIISQTLLTTVKFTVYCQINCCLFDFCFLEGHQRRGKSRWEEREERCSPSSHHVLRIPREQLQGSPQTEEGLGDPADKRGGEFSRTIPSDARQRKWQIWWFSFLFLALTAGSLPSKTLIVVSWWMVIKERDTLANLVCSPCPHG